jgi:hypothetical protein
MIDDGRGGGGGGSIGCSVDIGRFKTEPKI